MWLTGGKWRDTIRIYVDTPEADTPQAFGAKAKARKGRGLSWIKVDVGDGPAEGEAGDADVAGGPGCDCDDQMFDDQLFS